MAGGHQLSDFFGNGLAHAGDLLQVLPLLHHLLDLHGEVLDGAGCPLIGANLEQVLALHLQQVGDVRENFSDGTVFHESLVFGMF